MARQSVDLGRAREALRYIQLAGTHASGWAPPRVECLLHIREAQGHAAASDPASFEFAMTKAWRAFEKGETDHDPEWVHFLNEAEVVCLEGMGRSDLGQFRRAIRLLTRSATLQRVEHARNKGMCLARLANSAVRDRDLDNTAFATRESIGLIESGMTSVRNMAQLRLVITQLDPLRRTDRRARALSDELSAHVPAA